MSKDEVSIDFLVIGAGIAGASVAAELIQHGSVKILEAEAVPGYHTTGRSASMLLEFHGDKVMRALVRHSRPFFEAPPGNFTAGSLLRRIGVLFIARPDQADSLTRKIERNLEDPAAAIRGDRQLAVARHPGLRPEYIGSCLWHPDALEIDVHAVLQGYLRKFRRSGGQLQAGETVESLRRDGDCWTAQTRNGSYRSPVIVNAAGAWADRVGRLAGAQPIGLVPKRRSVCVVPAGRADISDWPMVGDVDDQFYFRPEGGQLLLSPSEETAIDPCDVYADDLAIARAVECLETVTRIRVTRKIARQWAGLRSFVDDRLPVIGYDAKARGFFWLAAQGGDGIQTSPALSRLATALVLNEPVPGDLAAAGITPEVLSPARLPVA